MNWKEGVPLLGEEGWLRSIFLMAQPPLLSEEGNALPWQFIYTFIDRRYS